MPTLSELRKRPHWSYSSLNTFLNVCSLQWAFSHVYEREPAFTPAALVFGRVFHRACEFASIRRMESVPAEPGQVLDLFSDLLVQECATADPAIRFDDGDNADALNALGRRMLEAWLPAIDPNEEILAVAVPFCADIEDADGQPLDRPLIGEFDMLVKDSTGDVIVDWKTSARRWPADKARLELQPTCYLYAHLRSGGSPATRFRFDVITKTKQPAVERYVTVRTDDAFLRLAETIRVVSKVVRDELFLPDDQSWACGDCPYGLACRAWHRERSRSLYTLKLAA